jgi:hypothetical protein
MGPLLQLSDSEMWVLYVLKQINEQRGDPHSKVVIVKKGNISEQIVKLPIVNRSIIHRKIEHPSSQERGT